MFPTIVYQGTVECHQEFKKKNLDSLRSYWFNGYENESPEYSGRIFTHQKPEYRQFFKELRTHVDNYFKVLNVDYNKLDYHIIKSWVGCHLNDETPSIKPHTHNESNLSYVYYVKTDETSDKLCIAQPKNKNECVEDLFQTAIQRNLITSYNQYNCNYYTVTPKEGTVVIFPSNIGHFTQKITTRKDERIVMPGDIRVTLKREHFDYHQGSTHPSQWLEL
jgi:uncharacterized protein (TIGR02466 family)